MRDDRWILWVLVIGLTATIAGLIISAWLADQVVYHTQCHCIIGLFK